MQDHPKTFDADRCGFEQAEVLALFSLFAIAPVVCAYLIPFLVSIAMTGRPLGSARLWPPGRRQRRNHQLESYGVMRR